MRFDWELTDLSVSLHQKFAEITNSKVITLNSQLYHIFRYDENHSLNESFYNDVPYGQLSRRQNTKKIVVPHLRIMIFSYLCKI